MCLLQQQHAQAALTDASAYRAWQFAVEKGFVERQLGSFGTTSEFELVPERLGAYTYAHRRDLEGYVKHMVPYDYVTVQAGVALLVLGAPVVIVGGASVVRLAVGQVCAYTYYKYGAVLTCRQCLAFAGVSSG